MAKRQLSMRQIREILRLYWHLGHNKAAISRITKIPRSTVNEYIIRSSALNLKWPLPEHLTEEELYLQLFPKSRKPKNTAEPDWQKIHKELRRKGVTRQLLWAEYKRENPDGFNYSWFADKYHKWAKEHKVWMHQPHKAGEEVYVDFSGLTVPIWDKKMQEILFEAEIFVAVLGASDLIYCCASTNQKLLSWIEVHCNMFEFYGGVSELIIPDNLRSAVNKAHRYEPINNRTYEDMAEHYGCAIMPARSFRPKDKAKAEKSVQTIQRSILAPVRDDKFTSTESLNNYICNQLIEINNRNFQKLPYSRQELFVEIERSALLPLPDTRYVMSEWFSETLNGGYHICIYEHYYSIPYQYVGKKIDCKVANKIIEFFHREQRIACHHRSYEKGKYTTLPEHMPEAHRQQLLWNAERLSKWAQNIGGSICLLINMVLTNKYRNIRKRERSALGILRLSHAYGEKRLELACGKALQIGTTRYSSIQSILKNGLECKGNDKTTKEEKHIKHENLRGQEYYH